MGLDIERGVCVVCGGRMRPWLAVPGDWRRPEADESYSLVRCERCRLGRLDPIPPPDRVASFYDVADYYTHVQEGSHRDARTRRFGEAMLRRIGCRLDRGEHADADWVVRSVLPSRPSRVLEIGCGDGGRLAQLAARGHTVLGVEPDPVAREAAARLGVTVHDGMAEELPEAVCGDPYDVILLIHVLEHTRDPILSLARAGELLAADGTLVIECPNQDAASYKRSGLAWRNLDVPRHLSYFTVTSLEGACRRAGLVPKRTDFVGYGRQFSAPWLASEQRIWDFFRERGGGEPTLPPRNSVRRSWALLLKTSCARPRAKYDTIRTLAKRS